ncbi:MAG: hypothetical protein WAU41_06325 [Gaiellaceae bacterium]
MPNVLCALQILIAPEYRGGDGRTAHISTLGCERTSGSVQTSTIILVSEKPLIKLSGFADEGCGLLVLAVT